MGLLSRNKKRRLPENVKTSGNLIFRHIYGTMELVNAPLLFQKTVADK